MTWTDRVRSWFSSGRDVRPDASQPTAPMPGPREVEAAAPQSQSEPEVAAPEEQDVLMEGLPIAEGQELLGPCRTCEGYWTRIKVRGAKPQTCPVCKEVE